MRIPRAAFPLLLLALARSLPLAAQAQLLKDVNTARAPQSSNPGGFVRSGNFVYFDATTPATGRELFRTDGTAEGTVLESDTLVGNLSGVTDDLVGGYPPDWIRPPERVDLQGTLYFTGSDGRGGRTLWRADGPRAGPVLDLFPGRNASVRGLTVTGDRLFFLAQTSLFVTDGTEAGTHRVTGVSEPCTTIHFFTSCTTSVLVALGDTLYFTSGGRDARVLYRTSGAPDDVTPVATKAIPLAVAGGRLLYADPFGLQAADGVSTWHLADTAPADFDGAALGSLLVFRNGDALWRSDGTPEGTFPLGAGGVDRVLGAAGGRVVFAVLTGGAHALWATDGTRAGTTLLSLVGAGSLDAAAAATDGVFALFHDASGLAQLWWSDGTAAGTWRVATMAASPGRSMATLDRRAFFMLCESAHGCEPWVSDATGAGTHVLADLDPESGASSFPWDFADADGTLFFRAQDEEHGEEVWTSDGTSAGTRLVADVTPGPVSTSMGLLTTLGRLAFFARYDNGRPDSLWRTDGTAVGTFSLGVPADLMAASGGWLWFLEPDPDLPSREKTLHRTDGTDVSLVASLAPQPEVFALEPLGDGSVVFFAGESGVTSLVRSDGTSAGTASFASLPGYQLATLAWQGKVLFTISTYGGRSRLFETDGTAAGTRQLADRDFSPGAELATTGVAVFIADRDGLWAVTNGTAVRVTTAWTGFFGGTAALGDVLVFSACDERGCEPWRSDGTPGGTRILADLAPGTASSSPSGFLAAGGRVIFSATGAWLGRELWCTDGSRAGTRLAADVRRGPGDGVDSITPPVLSGGTIYFAADDGGTGREPWALPLSALPCGAAPCRVVGGGAGGSPLRR